MLKVLFPCCIMMHRSFSVCLFINSLWERSCVHCRKKKSLSQKHHLASQSGDSCTYLPDILILIQRLKRMSWQEIFLFNSQLLSILERHMQYFVVPPSCHRMRQQESKLLGAARLCHLSLCGHIAVSWLPENSLLARSSVSHLNSLPSGRQITI